MRKVLKIILGLGTVFAAAVVIAGLVLCTCWDQDAKPGRAKADVLQIGKSVRKVMEEGKLTWEAWDSINRMEDLAPFILPELEHGSAQLTDVFGGGFYRLEKHYELNQLVVTIRSRKESDPLWCGWHKKVLGIEITISKDQGKVTSIKHLWLCD